MREWIVTNGLGGYASLTRRHQNTRKYHGLLVSSLEPPTKRWIFVSNIFEDYLHHDISIPMTHASNTFSFSTFPHFHYRFDTTRITKTIFMPHQHNTTIIRYKISTSLPGALRFYPLITARHIYDVRFSQAVPYTQQVHNDTVHLTYGHTDIPLILQVPGAKYTPLEAIHFLEYPRDKERGDSHQDTLVKPGVFDISITKPTTIFFIMTTEKKPVINPESLYQKERKRKTQIIQQAGLQPEQDKLVLSTDQFLVKRNKGVSIIAGYHWFSDWGRDILIALPGVTLVTKRFDEAKTILNNFAYYCKNGLLPNVFHDRDDAIAYNTVDAPLWFIDRVFQYLKYTKDLPFLNSLWPTLTSIISAYKNGTDFGIHMDDTFLISHDPGLTWMDVKLGDYYPTPRDRQAVEIQALWYNALRIMDQCAQLIDKKGDFSSLAENTRHTFTEEYTALYDVINTRDQRIRPNMVFLVSLDFPLINKTMQKQIVSTAHKHLVTPFGLRTLAPSSPEYLGTYLGLHHRDKAYHNGTVWPWLLGPFVTAYVKTHNRKLQSRQQAYEEFLEPMVHIFGEIWDGSIPEIFDGDPPFMPRGCINQAWSVAEILRCWIEDIQDIRPPYEQMLLHKIRV